MLSVLFSLETERLINFDIYTHESSIAASTDCVVVLNLVKGNVSL